MEWMGGACLDFDTFDPNSAPIKLIDGHGRQERLHGYIPNYYIEKYFTVQRCILAFLLIPQIANAALRVNP